MCAINNNEEGTMAKIRLQNVTVSFGTIEIDDVQIPEQMLNSFQVQEKTIEVPKATEVAPVESKQTAPAKKQPKKKAVKRVKVEEAPRDKVEPLPKEIVEFDEHSPDRKLPSPEDFADATRLRDVVKVFHQAGFMDEASIVEGCHALKAEVSILKKVRDIGVRIPIAIEKMREDQSNA